MKLTKAQERAKKKLTTKWLSAHELQESIPTLEGLVSNKFYCPKLTKLGGSLAEKNTGVKILCGCCRKPFLSWDKIKNKRCAKCKSGSSHDYEYKEGR